MAARAVTSREQARRYLRAHPIGVLSTLSKTVAGYPFGSVVPFITDHEARPVMFISALAEHTRSLAETPRASLITHDFSVAQSAGPRLTLFADAERCTDAAMARRYTRFFPESERLLAFGDFSFWRLVPLRALFIRGFGRIEWIEGSALGPPPSTVGAAEEDIIAHMNQDHAQALADYCRHVHGVDAATPRMVGIDCDGFDVRAGERLLHFAFETVVSDAVAARRALVALAQQARQP